jgi:hypothetical protein
MEQTNKKNAEIINAAKKELESVFGKNWTEKVERNDSEVLSVIKKYALQYGVTEEAYDNCDIAYISFYELLV